MANMADITNSCSSRSLQAAQPPRSHKQPFPRSFARVRAREGLGVREKGEGRGGGRLTTAGDKMLDADERLLTSQARDVLIPRYTRVMLTY